MRRSAALVLAGAAALAVTTLSVGVTAVAAPGSDRPAQYVGHRGPLAVRGATADAVSPPGVGEVSQATELKSPEVEARQNSPQGGSTVLTGKLRPPSAASVPVTQNASGVTSRFEGLNHFDSRYSDGGNAFSGEPPDQGLCVGGG